MISVSETKMLASVVRLNLQVNDVKDARHTPKYWPRRSIKGWRKPRKENLQLYYIVYSIMRVLGWRTAVERMKESNLLFHNYTVFL